MFFHRKLLVLSSICFSLVGCLEVDDNSNQSVAKALNDRNDTFQEQKTPITIFGSVTNAATDNPVTDAIINIKVGTEWREPVIVSGEFSIQDLPVNTDIVLLVQSTDGSFMDRAFYGKTLSVDTGQVASQALGNLKVSEGIEKTYTILNASDSEPFQGLEFSYSVSTSFSDNYDFNAIDSYRSTSIYDSAASLYTITLPKHLNFILVASTDTDGDDIADFTPENNNFSSGNNLQLLASEAIQLDTLYLNSATTYSPVEIRISIINKFGDILENLEIIASDQFKGRLETSFDANTNEYTFNYHALNSVSVLMPGFTSDTGDNYSSGSIELNWATDTELNIYSSGFENNITDNIEVINGIATIVIQPKIISEYNNNRVVSSLIDEFDNSLKQFYQEPVVLSDNSVSLEKTDVFTVIKGNQSTDDLIPNGTTQVGTITLDIPLSTSLSYNDTFLTSTPSQTLTPGSYVYRLNEILDKQTGNNLTYYTNYQFELDKIPDTSTFNIDDIKLDNNNGSTNGSIIVSQNTANETSTIIFNYNQVSLYFPTSIESLDFLELYLVSSINNGIQQINQRTISVIKNNATYADIINLISLATNEQIKSVSNGYYYNNSVNMYTSLSDGLWYRSNTGLYYNDHTSTQENTATFNYIYRISGQQNIHEGTITLQVQ